LQKQKRLARNQGITLSSSDQRNSNTKSQVTQIEPAVEITAAAAAEKLRQDSRELNKNVDNVTVPDEISISDNILSLNGMKFPTVSSFGVRKMSVEVNNPV
jgi:hypothetical protein